MGSLWISWLLLTLTYLTFGRFLQAVEFASPLYLWVLSALFAVLLAAVTTIFWKPARDVMLLGFQSDAGYFIMALLLTSVVVIAVVQFRAFTYLLIMIASTLLARVNTLLAAFNNRTAFLLIVFFPLLGLALSWAPWFFAHSGQGEPVTLLSF